MYYLIDNINIKKFYPSNIKIDETPYKNIFISYIGYETIKNSKYIKSDSLNPLYLIFNKVNGYFEEINGNKLLTLVPTNKSKEIIKQYEEMLSKFSYLIRPVTANSNDYDKKYMKIKFNLDDEVPLNKTIEIIGMIIVVRAVFHGNTNIIHKFS